MTNHDRQYSKVDQLCLSMDEALRALFGNVSSMQRSYPAENIPEADLTPSERKDIAGLMRVNHAGEVCAQALYHGQGLVSRNPALQQQLKDAAREEGDHLAWCSKRIDELGSHTSFLNPLWYAGSFAIGVVAGCVSDNCSLGFVAETETQVVKHLETHLQTIPPKDVKSHKILRQMQQDEASHRDEAIKSGADLLPQFVKKIMALTATLMVKTAYWI